MRAIFMVALLLVALTGEARAACPAAEPPAAFYDCVVIHELIYPELRNTVAQARVYCRDLGRRDVKRCAGEVLKYMARQAIAEDAQPRSVPTVNPCDMMAVRDAVNQAMPGADPSVKMMALERWMALGCK
jgi:hypothetical protein